ncbi:hypothetical protein F4808DRAFT_454952 [Astrocystis sublimbata]|nr:hypothetical protein F4808DRAFT_454952 [Astrocystis sublimbata]
MNQARVAFSHLRAPRVFTLPRPHLTNLKTYPRPFAFTAAPSHRAMSEYKLKDASALSLQLGEEGNRACFNAKTGDVEDAPALDALTTFEVVERDGALYIKGEEAAIKSGRRQPNIRCRGGVNTSESDRVVVVGGGSATIAAVEALRDGGFSGSVTVVTKEGYLPIDRTKLSKALLTDVEKAQWRNADPVATESGSKLTYGKLILATGGTPRNLPLQGFKVLEKHLRAQNFARRQENCGCDRRKGKKIVVVGSSFIGMEIANATAADNSVAVIGMESTPLERVLGKEVGAGLQKGLEGKGIKFYMSASVDKAEPSAADPSKVGSVLLKDGTKLEADLVILGVGVAPATEFLKDSKVDVYAIGDIATYPYHGPGGEGKPTRIEHWDVAQNQGRSVAKHIIRPSAKPEFFTPVFWSALTGPVALLWKYRQRLG